MTSTITYRSRRGKRDITREGSVIVDAHPGDERRLVLHRPNGKKLMVHLNKKMVWQRRDDESKWTKIARFIVDADIHIEDECPDCGSTTGRLKYQSAWTVECTDCGELHSPRTEPEEPAYPEPDSDDHSDILEAVQEYAEVVNEEIFDGDLSTGNITWKWNGHNRSTAGRCYGYGTIELTPQYYEKHGWNELLKVVRHELVHMWEHHAGNERAGHDVQFHDWLVPANTRRHCKHF